jgi:transposase-like protein
MDVTKRCGCGCGKSTRLDRWGRPRQFAQGHNRRGRGNGWLEQGYHFIQHNGRRRALHRVLVEQREGRTLDRNEVVHHIDGNPLNNTLSNLTILSRAEHTRQHHSRVSKKRWSAEDKLRTVELYKTGMSMDEVARATGRPYSSTERVIVRAGEARTPRETRALRDSSPRPTYTEKQERREREEASRSPPTRSR